MIQILKNYSIFYFPINFLNNFGILCLINVLQKNIKEMTEILMSRAFLIYHMSRNKCNYNFKSSLVIIHKVKLDIKFLLQHITIQIISLKASISQLNLIIQYWKQNQMDFLKQLVDRVQMRSQAFMRNLEVDFNNFDKPASPSPITFFQSLLERSIAIVSSKNESHFNKIYDYLQAPSTSNCSDKIENQKQEKMALSVQKISQQIYNSSQFDDQIDEQFPIVIQAEPILNIDDNEQFRQKQYAESKIQQSKQLEAKVLEENKIEDLKLNISQDMEKSINEQAIEINNQNLSSFLQQNNKEPPQQILPPKSKTHDKGQAILKRDIAKQFEQRRLQILNRQTKANKMIKSLLSQRNPQLTKQYQEIKKKQLQTKLEDNIIFLKQIESNKKEKKNQISEWKQSSVQKDLLQKIKASNKQKMQSLGFSKSISNKYNKYAKGNIEFTPQRQKVNHFPKLDKSYTIFKPVPYTLYTINQKANQFYKI